MQAFVCFGDTKHVFTFFY